jgi:hypothetical protein
VEAQPRRPSTSPRQRRHLGGAQRHVSVHAESFAALPGPTGPLARSGAGGPPPRASNASIAARAALASSQLTGPSPLGSAHQEMAPDDGLPLVGAPADPAVRGGEHAAAVDGSPGHAPTTDSGAPPKGPIGAAAPRRSQQQHHHHHQQHARKAGARGAAAQHAARQPPASAAPVIITSACRAKRRLPPQAATAPAVPAPVRPSGRAARAGAGGRMAQILQAEGASEEEDEEDEEAAAAEGSDDEPQQASGGNVGSGGVVAHGGGCRLPACICMALQHVRLCMRG